jgi:FkbM family methyltransferase
MLTHILAKNERGPSLVIKYKLKNLRRPYTSLMRLGEPILRVPTIAGTINWEVDELTSQQFVLGTYEPYMQRAFVKFIKPGAVVYDVGAHAGYHSLLCGLLVGPTGSVFAFEPHPGNRKSIRRQLILNPVLNVTLMAYALSDRCSGVYLNCGPGRSQGYLSDEGDLAVEAKSIDYLVEKETLPAPDIIKIDVEGFEAQVLRGALKTINSYKPIILCDYNDNQTFSLVQELTAPFGYEITGDSLVTAIPQQKE